MLSALEQKSVVEQQPHHTDQQGITRSPRARRKAPWAFLALWWVSVLSLIVGAHLPGLGIAAAVVLGWLLWRYLPGMEDVSEPSSNRPDDGDDRDQHSDRSRPRHRSDLAKSPHVRSMR